MSNVENKNKATVNSKKKIKQKCNFIEQKADNEKAEAEIVKDVINDVPYEHIKTDQQYIELTVDDAQTIEDQIKKKKMKIS